MTELSRPTLRGNMRAMPAPAWVLFAGTFVNRSGSFVLPFLILYLTSRGYPVVVAGAVTAAYGVGGLASRRPRRDGHWLRDHLVFQSS